MKVKQEYQVTCFVCYSCIIARTKSRREADREATSHMNLYGHHVEVMAPKQTETVSEVRT